MTWMMPGRTRISLQSRLRAGLALTTAAYAFFLGVGLLVVPVQGVVGFTARGAVAGLAALACVTAEAVWSLRPWAMRAARALAVSSAAAAVAGGIAAWIGGDLEGGVVMMVMAAGAWLIGTRMVEYVAEVFRAGRP
jgi:hypothetical protein